MFGMVPWQEIDVDPGCHTSPGTAGPVSAVPLPLASRTTEALAARLTVLAMGHPAIMW